MKKLLTRLFHKREHKKNIAALRALKPDAKKVAASDFAMTNFIIQNCDPEHLPYLLFDATNSRRAAIAQGAINRKFGSWLVPAENETLVTLALLDGRSSAIFQSAYSDVANFVEVYSDPLTIQMAETTAQYTIATLGD